VEHVGLAVDEPLGSDLERVLGEDPTAERAVDADAALELHVAGVVASRTEDGGERSFGSHPVS
jgi:hypothetical protein